MVTTSKTTGAGNGKKRAPPSFQHLPRERGEYKLSFRSNISLKSLPSFIALKLKKQWIEKKKLKSRWNAQKRREGLSTSGASIEPHSLGGDRSDDQESSEGPGSSPSSRDAARKVTDLRKQSGNSPAPSPFPNSSRPALALVLAFARSLTR